MVDRTRYGVGAAGHRGPRDMLMAQNQGLRPPEPSNFRGTNPLLSGCVPTCRRPSFCLIRRDLIANIGCAQNDLFNKQSPL